MALANASLKAGLIGLAGTLLSGCTPSRAVHHWWGPDGLSAQSVEQVVQDNPLAHDQNIHVVNLGATSNISHHVVQVREAEAFHIHRGCDLTVFIHRGHGELRIENQKFNVRAGDVIFVPKGVPHAFRNTARRPSVAIVSFSPPFDGKDTAAVADVHK